MPDYTETKTRLIINKLSREKYDYLVSNDLISENELYLVKDTNLDAVSARLINVGDPVSATDGANKQYVDNAIDFVSGGLFDEISGTSATLYTEITANTSNIEIISSTLSTKLDVSENNTRLSFADADSTGLTITDITSGFSTTYGTSGIEYGVDAFSVTDASGNTIFVPSGTSGTLALQDQIPDVTTKLDSVAGAPDFNPSSTYFVGDYVTYLGKLYRCTTAVTASGFWTGSTNWTETDMTSPDATVDITNDGFLRVVSADGEILWAEGYNFSEDSSDSMANWSVKGYTFAANATSGVTVSLPSVMAGKVGDFILDVTNPALATASLPTAFSDASAYAAGEIVSYDSKIWRCVVAVETAGAWTGTTNWEEAWPYFTLAQMTAMTVSVVVPAGEDLQDMLTFAPGTMCELYFTQTAFNVDSKPTWKVVRQDVESGGAS